MRQRSHRWRSLPHAVAALALCGSVLVPPASGAEPRPEGFDPSRWTLKVFGAAAPGSGVVVESGPGRCLALTAGHVIKGTSLEDEPHARLADGRRLSITAIRDLAPLDLAELELAGCTAATPPLARTPHPGGTVWAAGFPQEANSLWVRSGPSESQGSTPEARQGGYAIFHGAQTRIGISGGGVYNAMGQLIGIHGEADTTTTRSGRSYKSGIGLAIPISFWLNRQSQAGREPGLQDGLLRLAWLESARKRQEALALATQLIQANPDDPRPRIRRAGLWLAEAKYTEALADYNTLLNQSPGQASLLINRGNALSGLGRRAEALDDYDRAIAAAPTLSWGHLNRAKALLALGRIEEAVSSLDRALALNPNDRAVRSERAALRHRLGQRREALKDLDLLLTQQPDDAEAMARRGLIRGELGDLRGSIDDLTAAIDLQPDEPSHRLNRGVTLARLKQWDAAETELRQVLRMTGNSPELLANLGEVVYMRGRGAEGCALARQAMGLGFRWSQGEWHPLYREACSSL